MTARDHTGVVATGGRIHLIGGRVDTFYTNSHLHHAYDPAADKWEPRAPFPTKIEKNSPCWAYSTTQRLDRIRNGFVFTTPLPFSS